MKMFLHDLPLALGLSRNEDFLDEEDEEVVLFVVVVSIVSSELLASEACLRHSRRQM